MTGDELETYLGALLREPKLQRLWEVSDRGMPVFAHTIDVALLVLEEYPSWRGRHPSLDLPVLVIGGLLHDLSKLRSHHDCSHSDLMSLRPAVASDEAAELLAAVETKHGISLGAERLAHVLHVVASHHGRWGRVRPRTPEALLVHRCDYRSATQHRLAPVDANDILPLLATGCRWPQVGARLGVGRTVVKTRLGESCRAEQVRDWVDLLDLWRASGRVRVGPPERARQLERVRLVIRLARQVPDCLFQRIRPLLAAGSALPGTRLALDDTPSETG